MKNFLLCLVIVMVGCDGEQPGAAASETATDKEGAKPAAEKVGDSETGKTATVVADPAADSRPATPAADGVHVLAFKLTADNCTDPDLAKLHKGVTMMLCDGTVAEGSYEPPTVPPPPNLVELVPGNIRKGVVINGVAGTYEVVMPAQPDLTHLVAGNVKQGVTINGVTGSYDNRPADCSGYDEVGCVTTATKVIKDLSNLSSGNVKAGVTIAEVLGTYSGATVPADCTNNGEVGCVSTSTYKAADLSNLSAANVKSGVTLAGVTGSYDNRPADCSSNGQEGCVATATYKAADLSNLSSGNVKAGVTIAGTAGQYPSATYKLAGADGTADLTNGTFDAKVKSATAFEWFDADGVRYIYQGDADLATAANIKDGITIFGQLGTLTTITAPDQWNLRKDVVVGAVTGQAKMTCRQRSGLAPASDKCVGESYVDITDNGQTCSSSPSTCMYQDKISGLTIAKSGGAKTWANADSYCSSLVVDGVSGWRLAEREELQRMFIQGISYTSSLVVDGTIAYWSSTAGTTGKYAVRILDNGATTDTAATSSTPGTLCVK